MNLFLNIMYVIALIHNLVWVHKYRNTYVYENDFDLAKDVFMGVLVSILPLLNVVMMISIIILSRKPKS